MPSIKNSNAIARKFYLIYCTLYDENLVTEINTVLIKYMIMIMIFLAYTERIKKGNISALSLNIYRARKNDSHHDGDFLESS